MIKRSLSLVLLHTCGCLEVEVGPESYAHSFNPTPSHVDCLQCTKMEWEGLIDL